MVSLIQAVILSIIQGITEWLPISSSGHLALINSLFGPQNISYYVFLHFSSVFAILVVFWKDIIKLFKLNSESLRYIALLIIASIPAGIVGFVLAEKIEAFFSNMFYLGLFFIFSGIVVYLTKFSSEKKEKINLIDSVFIGLFQALAILPGISRSGMVISSGLFAGLSKKSSIRFSFLMAIPLILGASLIKAQDLFLIEINYFILAVSFSITFLVSLITIKILIKIIKNDKFYLFGFYNFILGVLVLLWTLR